MPGKLIGIRDAPDGTLDITIETPDGREHTFTGCYIKSYSTGAISAAAPDTIRLEHVAVMSADPTCPTLEFMEMALPRSQFNKNLDMFASLGNLQSFEHKDKVPKIRRILPEALSPLHVRLVAVLKTYGWPDYIDISGHTYEPAHKLLEELVEAAKEKNE